MARNESEPLDKELEREKDRGTLNNFRGYLPGGYRRQPRYLDGLSEQSLRRIHEHTSLVDATIAELGLDPAIVERAQMQCVNAVLASINDYSLIPQSEEAKALFFNEYEFPIYSELRRRHQQYDSYFWTG